MTGRKRYRGQLLWLAAVTALLSVVMLVLFAVEAHQRSAIQAGNDANPDSPIALTFYFERQVLLLQRDLAAAIQ